MSGAGLRPFPAGKAGGTAPGASLTAAAPPAAGAGVPDGVAPGVELFIYYRVPAAHAADALAAARAAQRSACAAHPGLTARLLRRREPADADETWMETYRFDGGAAADATASNPPPGIDAALQAAIERHARPLARWIAGPRHVERFTACA